ncbi:CTLH/CRA C-terminal to lish motif domain-containing protein [Haematococcus lacustris]
MAVAAASILDASESSLLRVPFESLKRAAKDRKNILDELQDAVSALDDEAATPETMDILIVKLQGLKRKLADVSLAEATGAEQCQARMHHLQQLSCTPTTSMVAWNKQRLDRMLVDHMQRSGYHASSLVLSQQAGLQPLVDSGIYLEAQKVLAALVQHDCGPALAWCAEQRSRLKKAKSPLEFKLRVQEFVELVRNERRMEAVAYARAHLAVWAATYMPELQRAMALLAFRPDPDHCPAPYLELYQEQQWEQLGQLFKKDLYRLHGLPPQSQLVVHLQAGLSALNTPASQQPESNREDPLSLPAFQRLAQGLPQAKHVHSKLLCSVTRTLMTDANPPVVLPNGFVYSQAAVDRICAANGGRMVCPRTGSAYSPDELRRAFIV